MKIVFGLILCSLLLLQAVESSKKLLICAKFNKNDKAHNEKVVLSFNKTLEKLSGGKDEIVIDGTFPMQLNLKDLISGNVSVTDLTISGYMDIEYQMFPSLLTPVIITVKNIIVKGKDYSLAGSVSDLFDIYGSNGSFNVSLQGITISVDKLTPSLFHLGCFNVNVDVKLQALKAYFANLMGGDPTLEPILNQVIGDLGPDVVDYYWPIIYDTIQPFVQKIIDKYVNKKELENFLTILSGDGFGELKG